MTRAKEMREMVLAIDAHTNGNITVTGNIEQSGVAAMKIPTGTTAQRHGSPTAGHLRFNTDTNSAEIYNGSSFTSVGGGATGGGSDETFLETIDKCKKGDVLAFGFSRGPVSKDTYNFTKKIAQACIIDTVQISDFRALCIYRGQLRKER